MSSSSSSDDVSKGFLGALDDGAGALVLGSTGSLADTAALVDTGAGADDIGAGGRCGFDGTGEGTRVSLWPPSARGERTGTTAAVFNFFHVDLATSFDILTGGSSFGRTIFQTASTCFGLIPHFFERTPQVTSCSSLVVRMPFRWSLTQKSQTAGPPEM